MKSRMIIVENNFLSSAVYIAMCVVYIIIEYSNGDSSEYTGEVCID